MYRYWSSPQVSSMTSLPRRLPWRKPRQQPYIQRRSRRCQIYGFLSADAYSDVPGGETAEPVLVGTISVDSLVAMTKFSARSRRRPTGEKPLTLSNRNKYILRMIRSLNQKIRWGPKSTCKSVGGSIPTKWEGPKHAQSGPRCSVFIIYHGFSRYIDQRRG